MDLDSEDIPDVPADPGEGVPGFPAREDSGSTWKPRTEWYFPAHRELEKRFHQGFLRETIACHGWEKCERAMAEMESRIVNRKLQAPKIAMAWKILLSTIRGIVDQEKFMKQMEVKENQLSLLLEKGDTFQIGDRKIAYRDGWIVDGKPATWASFRWVAKGAALHGWAIRATDTASRERLKDFPILGGASGATAEGNSVRPGSPKAPEQRRGSPRDH